MYPLKPTAPLLTRNLSVARHPGTYARVRALEKRAAGLFLGANDAPPPSSALPHAGGGAAVSSNPAPTDDVQSPQGFPGLGSVSVITAAMPCGQADRRPPGGWAGSSWAHDVAVRVRAVLLCAAQSGHANLVLGAWGCGAFGNPAGPVAAVFREQLAAPECRGRFGVVVFAVLDPLGTGNLGPFRRELKLLR